MSIVQGKEPFTQPKEAEAKARRLSGISNDLCAAVFSFFSVNIDSQIIMLYSSVVQFHCNCVEYFCVL